KPYISIKSYPMLPNIDFTATTAYQQLGRHYADISRKLLIDKIKEDPHRLERFSITFSDHLHDSSYKQNNAQTNALMILIAQDTQLPEAIEAMFTGNAINQTENRAVLHTALRSPGSEPLVVNGQYVTADVNTVLAKMKAFSEAIISGSWK